MADLVVGGWSPPQPATPKVQVITQQVKPQLESQDGRASPFILFIAVLYRSQVVSGTNYLIKVRCGYGAKDYAHLLVFEALPVSGGQAVLQGYQLGRTRSDPLTPW
ncbi:cystatin-A5-like isoform X3 [Hemicordylus capensis]|uniref:cystatin-A5-like isoform X3 n=1 Tax=Hemicordylus capensis TaxID=884348 RepID=UPI002303B41B|nr:cystatin-A5-like isoform X3 [Hemicordylus capensis]